MSLSPRPPVLLFFFDLPLKRRVDHVEDRTERVQFIQQVNFPPPLRHVKGIVEVSVPEERRGEGRGDSSYLSDTAILMYVFTTHTHNTNMQ